LKIKIKIAEFIASAIENEKFLLIFKKNVKIFIIFFFVKFSILLHCIINLKTKIEISRMSFNIMNLTVIIFLLIIIKSKKKF
jgi:hypothetical protein